MPRVDTATWRQMMSYLTRRHAPICRQWFEQLQPGDLDAGLLNIHASTSIQKNYLQRKCLAPFTDAAQAATGALVAVRFVDAEEAPGLSESVEVVATVAAGARSETEELTPRVGRSRQASWSSSANLEHDGDEFDADQILLSPDYVFETFVTGPNNRLSHAAAVAVASRPGEAYNPLFIHGGVGLGKTHLLQAICQAILQASGSTQICYLSCDAFMNQFLDCVQSGRMNEFRHRYRHVDVLVIDDIHFLAKRDRSQEEFFHTFNALYQRNKQIVLSSDSPPDEIPQLEERLVSRFQWGLVTVVTKPCYETRVAIIRSKAKLRSLELTDDVVAYMAAKIDSNARELEGAITTIQGHATLQDRAITLELAKEALGEPPLGTPDAQITLQNIIDVVTQFYNVRLSDLQSKKRHKSITLPRQVCMWLARKRTRFSLQEIGGYFGGRDHTTVMHSIKMIDDRVHNDDGFSGQLDQLDERLTSSRQT